jgi:L-asparaginase/Glu-tRNA(Gln) amidotransferase subunit D
MILGQPSGIEHIATGGTMDSVWSPEKDTAVPAQVSMAAEYLQFLSRHGYPDIPSEVLVLKDSRDIEIEDKKLVARRVAESAVRKAIVTSGTYLMTDIGRRIQAHPTMRNNYFNKCVAMVASLTPLEGFSMSDGGFNLGMAQAVLEDLDPQQSSSVVGVVNGVVAPISVLEKDLTTATFESVDTSDSLLGYSHYTLVPAGGTIDFVFNGLDGVEPAETSFVPGYIRNKVRSSIEFDSTPPILKDSRNLTPVDIDMVIEIVRQAPSEFVLVTSGVLKMPDLRARLDKALASGDDHDRNRRVVLTGARYMLNSLDRSDAPFNLGYAHGKLGTVKPGAHIAIAAD